MDIPAIHLVRADGVAHDAPVMLDAVENYLKLKGNDDRIFVRTARRNGSYVAKLLGNRPINIGDSAKVTPVSFPPENIDVDWIISETDEYGSWTDRNPL
jgi:hypothetical protein